MVDRGEDALNPPFTPELLADLHGGVLAPRVADSLRDAVAGDSAAQDTLDALDRVRADLGRLRSDPPHPTPIPPDVLARLHAALAGDTESGLASVTALSARRRQPMRIAMAAAALVVFAACGVAVTTLTRPGTDPPADPIGVDVLADRPTVQLGDDLRPASALSLMGRNSLGMLSDPGRRSECLLANGIDPATQPLGSSPVQLRGVTGQLVLLPGTTAPKIVALVVGTRCGAGNPDTLARAEIG